MGGWMDGWAVFEDVDAGALVVVKEREREWKAGETHLFAKHNI